MIHCSVIKNNIMKTIEVIDETTINVDGENFYKGEGSFNLLRETNGYFKTGDDVIIFGTGNLCANHTEGKNYKGWVDGAAPDITKPLIILIFKRLNYSDACILKQGTGIFIFSGTESFTLAKPAIPCKKKINSQNKERT